MAAVIAPEGIDERIAAAYRRIAQEAAREDGGCLAEVVWCGVVAQARWESESSTVAVDFTERVNTAAVGDPTARAAQGWLSIADGARSVAWVEASWSLIGDWVSALMLAKAADTHDSPAADPECRAYVRAAQEIAAEDKSDLAQIVWSGALTEARWRWARLPKRTVEQAELFIAEAVFGDPVRLSARDSLHCPRCAGAVAAWLELRWKAVCARANELIVVSCLDPDAAR